MGATFYQLSSCYYRLNNKRIEGLGRVHSMHHGPDLWGL
jgi:hypothetical protein